MTRHRGHAEKVLRGCGGVARVLSNHEEVRNGFRLCAPPSEGPVGGKGRLGERASVQASRATRGKTIQARSSGKALHHKGHAWDPRDLDLVMPCPPPPPAGPAISALTCSCAVGPAALLGGLSASHTCEGGLAVGGSLGRGAVGLVGKRVTATAMRARNSRICVGPRVRGPGSCSLAVRAPESWCRCARAWLGVCRVGRGEGVVWLGTSAERGHGPNGKSAVTSVGRNVMPP